MAQDVRGIQTSKRKRIRGWYVGRTCSQAHLHDALERNFSHFLIIPLFFFLLRNGQTGNFPAKVPGYSTQEASVIRSSLVWCKTRNNKVAFSWHCISPSLPPQLQKHSCCGSWATPRSCNFLKSCSLSLPRLSCPIRTILGFFP